MIQEFLLVLNQTRVLHWQTPSHAEHKALGELYATLDDLVDDFIEKASGFAGSVERAAGTFDVSVINYENKEATLAFLDYVVKFLTVDLLEQVQPIQTDLLNVRDDMLGAVNQAKYLIRQT